MLKRLQTDQSLARYAGWFIPLKIETQGEPWNQWASKYRHEGNTIPIVFVVRADGQQLFGKSGSLPGMELPQMLEMSIRQAGAVYSDQQMNLLVTSLEKAKQANAQGDSEEAVEQLAKIRPLGVLGELGSYAEPATEADAFVKQLTDQGQKLLAKAEEQLAQDESVLSGAMALMEARRVYLPLPALKDEILQAYGEARSRTKLRDVLKQAEELDQVQKQLQTDVGKRRALVSLQRIVRDYPGQPAGQLAAKWMETHFPDQAGGTSTDDPSTMRQWVSSDGYTVQASLVDFGYTEADNAPYIILQTAEGKRVEVPFYRLSAESQQAAKEQVRQLKESTP